MFGSPTRCEGQHNELHSYAVTTPYNHPDSSSRDGLFVTGAYGRSSGGSVARCVCVCVFVYMCVPHRRKSIAIRHRRRRARSFQFTLLFSESLPICCRFNCCCLAGKAWPSCQRITRPLSERVDATRRTTGKREGFRIQGITTAHLRPGRLRLEPAWRDVQSQRGQRADAWLVRYEKLFFFDGKLLLRVVF